MLQIDLHFIMLKLISKCEDTQKALSFRKAKCTSNNTTVLHGGENGTSRIARGGATVKTLWSGGGGQSPQVFEAGDVSKTTKP